MMKRARAMKKMTIMLAKKLKKKRTRLSLESCIDQVPYLLVGKYQQGHSLPALAVLLLYIRI
jgi:hypothetical protein